jgi:PknH-like extracellular domain
LGGVVVGVFRSQVGRLRANLADSDSVTVIVGVDDDTQSMISGIARTLDRHNTLVVITNAGDDRLRRARRQGARVVLADFSNPSSLVSLRLWRHVSRLYLMAPDPAFNLLWLDLISRRLSELDYRHRLPLIVRMDDPWLAEAWRAQQFGGSDTRWAAHVVGKYEVTAGRLLDGIIATGRAKRVFVCGTSQLTLALCADLTQRALERDFYTPPCAVALPALTLVENDAEEYLRDHEFYRQQAGFMSEGPAIGAIAEAPNIPTLLRLIGDADPATSAVVLVHAHAATTGTRLAARLPEMQASVDKWKACAGQSITVIFDGKSSGWTFGEVTGAPPKIYQQRTQADGTRVCHHALHAVSSVVIDLLVCGPDAGTGEAAKIAGEIAAKVSQ